jgi:hypothetical protein
VFGKSKTEELGEPLSPLSGKKHLDARSTENAKIRKEPQSKRISLQKKLSLELKMPESPKGIKGLAQLLKYQLESKLLNSDCDDASDANRKMPRICRTIYQGCRKKILEIKEINNLIALANEQKHEVLNNLLAESNFKIELKDKRDKDQK